jgi:hypothetical protein
VRDGKVYTVTNDPPAPPQTWYEQLQQEIRRLGDLLLKKLLLASERL